ncbi:MAG TPA: hypothetical protein VFZ34_14300 [Blastocatellia bacterium]|nr:hypothetical protein [Blastocatellia bacterium]
MLRKIYLILCLWLVSLSALAQTPPPVVEVLDGLDPVMLSQGKETQGELQIAVTRGRFKYLFVNAENKAVFEKDPARYEIQLGGHCARMGAPVTGNPNLFTVHQGRAYIFGSEDCKKQFEAAPGKYLEPERAKPVAATPDSLQKGQALIAKTVAAMGGAEKIDGLMSYHEKSTSWQRRQQGEVEVKHNLLLAYPDRLRHERVMPDYRDPSVQMKQALIVTAGEAFGIGGPRGTFPIREGDKAAEASEVQRKPLSLLRARREAGFQAIAMGTAMIGTTTVEQVALTGIGGEVVIGIEPTTGRLFSLTQQRRGPDGSFGKFVQTFDDYRAVDGLLLPFKITATFDGQPWKEQSAQIEEIVINGKVEPALFERPKSEKPQ